MKIEKVGQKPRELSLPDLEEELLRVNQAKEITEKFLNSVNSLSEQQVTELQKLKANLELLKQLDKKESKEKYVKVLSDRKNNLNKIIETMKKTKAKIYDPREHGI